VSDEDNSLARRPTFGSRRVSVLVGLPVVTGCAVFGSIIGTTLPLGSMFPAAQHSGEPGDLRLASVKLVEAPSGAAQQLSTPQAGLPPDASQTVAGSRLAVPAPTSAPTSVLAVRTGSVDRPLSPGASLDGAQGDRPEAVHPDGAARAMGQGHRQARAKRLRRLLARQARPKSAAAQVDAFISSILPMK
jgi:hypothetical protein